MNDETALSESDIPDRPTRAPGVELSGEMPDSAFEDQPCLIVRNGAFVRVTSLLYLVAEAADGRRDADEMASLVSEATGRAVTADNVRELLRRQLIPLGIVAKADGSVVEPPDAETRSPLQIGMRTARIPGHVLEPLARAFKVLFAPPVLLAILVVGVAVVGWLFVVHGVGQGFRTAVYEPWLILVLLPLVVASAAFHEFGHAAALAYGGGQVRGMGAGFYTAYPVFFTDVTDNYRLKRWSRVRTDLGGFHFNLVFAIVIVALYVLTGHEFLLLAVLANIVGIVQQSIPLVRLDGYWALADMTGIPDPIASIKPVLKSVVPVPAWRDERAPRMKPWVRAVFLLWMAVAIPLVIVLTLFMLASAPRVIGTAIDSVRLQTATLQEALGRGDAVTVLASLLSMLVLAVTALAVAWFVVKLCRAIVGRLWSWAGDSNRRRALAGAGTLALVGVLAFLWAPALPFAGGRPGPYHDFSPIAEGEPLTIADAVGLAEPAPSSPPGGSDGRGRSPGAAASAPPASDSPPSPGIAAPSVEVPAAEEPQVDPPVDVPAEPAPPVEVPSVGVDVPAVDPPRVPDPATLVPELPVP